MDYEKIFREHVAGLKIKPNGQGMGLCPFHDDHNPSFSVNVEKGIWNCFGCGKHGKFKDFLREIKENENDAQ